MGRTSIRLPALSLLALVLAVVTFAGCQRASRYPAATAVKSLPRERTPEPAKPIWSWYLAEGWREPFDVPIVFVAHGHKDWDNLRVFWNHLPPPPVRGRMAHLGLSPLGIACAMVLADRLDVIKIKVPLGLPDPTPLVPAANPPTFEKWKLGRKIFFDRKLMAGGDSYACASCHQPLHGFTEGRAAAQGGQHNTPSLINSVYNRHQFWDGRARVLEEVVVHALDDELPPAQKTPPRRPQESHRWGGLVAALGADLDYVTAFQRTFGTQPTQDAIAKSVATYLRTILSGASLYDRAELERRRVNASELRAEHFAALLDETTLRALTASAETRDSMAGKLQRGHRLLQSKGCATCHPAPLFTDHDFHNIGIGESERYREPGTETGRFVHVPIGLKEPRLVGAFRTPTLRVLPRSAPYFHDGSAADLRTVVKTFDLGIHGYRSYLAPSLGTDADGNVRRLDLTDEDYEALLLFLRALDGEPVDEMMAAPR